MARFQKSLTHPVLSVEQSQLQGFEVDRVLATQGTSRVTVLS